MIIFPAIDIINGEAVRLFKGDYAQKTVYSKDPVSVAKTFKEKGATHVHLVDLDGAKAGEPKNFDLICRIKKETGLFAEVGGGIRTLDLIKRYLDAGIDRVILGTAAVVDKGFIPSLPACVRSKVAVGVDVSDGYVAIKGWTEKSDKTLFDFCAEMEAYGVGTVICTDISKDGAMKGTNHQLYKELSARTKMNVVASGGVSSLEDVKKLREQNIYGAIIGKAYYTGAIDLSEAIKEAK